MYKKASTNNLSKQHIGVNVAHANYSKKGNTKICNENFWKA